MSIWEEIFGPAVTCPCGATVGASDEARNAHICRRPKSLDVVVEEIPTIEATAPWDFITTDGAKE